MTDYQRFLQSKKQIAVSSGYQALLMGRKYIGIELKESYYNVALKNLQTAEGTSSIEQESLFDI